MTILCLMRFEDWTFREAERQEMWRRLAEVWGTGNNLEQIAPSRADDPRMKAWMARMERLSSSPGELMRLAQYIGDHDVSIRVLDDVGGVKVEAVADEEVFVPRRERRVGARHGPRGVPRDETEVVRRRRREARERLATLHRQVEPLDDRP